MLGKHDDCLLPNNSSFLVVDVMHLIEDDPFYITDHLSAAIEIVSQNFCCHDHATGLRVHAHITCYYTD